MRSGLPTVSLIPPAWRRLPRRTARLRLTVLYAGLFLVSSAVALAIVYLGSARSPALRFSVAVPSDALRPVIAHGAIRSVRGPAALARVRAVAASLQRSADLDHLLEVSAIVLGASAIVSTMLGWLAAGRVLRPLRAITDTAQTISAGSLHQRLALAGPDDEFTALGRTLDDLLARLEASFEAQRRFVANASHELRTPLTLERVLLQVTLADPDASAQTLRAACEELLASGAEQERLLEALLTLAASERGLERRQPVDLAPLAEQAVRAARARIERSSLVVRRRLAPAPAAGDPALIQRLIVNLVDNAVAHNVPEGEVTIATASDGADALVTVANTGPLIADDQIGRLFEPFQRLGGERASGGDGHAGLGLSIVRAIATAHGATVAARARPGGGLSLTVRFPARAPTPPPAVPPGPEAEIASVPAATPVLRAAPADR